MTGPEGGYYSHNTFKVDTSNEQMEASNESSSANSVFDEFSAGGLRELTSGPLNQIPWLAGDLNHPAVTFLSGDTVNAMRAYVHTPDKAERALLSKQIVAGFEEASERELDEAA